MALKDSQSQPITCVQCHAKADDGLYDDRAEQYYCNVKCYEDWANDNFDKLLEFYRIMNID